MKITLSIIFLFVFFFINLNIKAQIIELPNHTLAIKDTSLIGKIVKFNHSEYLIVDDSLLRSVVYEKKWPLDKVITTYVKDMSFLFNNSDKERFGVTKWDVSNVTNMEWMFAYNENFEENISNWNTSSVVKFSDMFHGTKKFNIDISKWDVSNAKYFNGMFHNSNFNKNINNWNMINAENTSGMFDDDKVYNQPMDRWNTSNIKNMGGMFAEAIKFNQDIRNWDVSNVEVMTNMFRNAKSFKYDLSIWNVLKINEKPEDFDFNANFKGPKFVKTNLFYTNYYLITLFGFIVIIISIYAYLKFKKKSYKTEAQLLNKIKITIEKKGNNIFTRDELDEILNISNKNIDNQRKLRSDFLKNIEKKGIAKVSRVKDNFDSRSYNYIIKINKFL